MYYVLIQVNFFFLIHKLNNYINIILIYDKKLLKKEHLVLQIFNV